MTSRSAAARLAPNVASLVVPWRAGDGRKPGETPVARGAGQGLRARRPATSPASGTVRGQLASTPPPTGHGDV